MDVSEHPLDLSTPAEEHSAPDEVITDPGIVATLAPVPPEALPALPRPLLRLAYAIEFWIVLIGVYVVWAQVGGQSHLDLIAWYIKLIFGLAVAWMMIRMTQAAVENTRMWNGRTIRWFSGIILVAALMAGVTYWYHLHEVPDEPDSDENSATNMWNHPADVDFPLVVALRDRKYA